MKAILESAARRGAFAGVCLALATSNAAPLVNLARTGTATQSSTGFGGVPELAIDGNTDGSFYNGSVTHTDAPPLANEWWEVELGGPKAIGRVHLWFRTDYGPEFRNNLRVVIYNVADPATRTEIWTQAIGTSPPDNLGFNLSSSVTGQVVRVEHVGPLAQFLALAEVEVFNESVEALANYAPGGTATATSAGFGSTAASAIDGTISSDFTPAGMFIPNTALDPSPAWIVDLGATKSIGRIQVWLRTDYCIACSEGLRVTVLDDGLNVVFQGVPPNLQYRSFGYSFGPLRDARYVRMDLAPDAPQPIPPFKILQFAEVQVFGGYTIAPVINISSPPAGQTVTAGTRATFGPVAASVDGAVLPEYVTFQWQRNGVDIPGANEPSYTTPFQSTSNDHDLYRVRVMVPGHSATSAEAELRVIAEAVPPLLVAASFAARTQLNLTLAFSEPIAASTTNLANYIFTGGPTALNATPGADGLSVVLAVNGLAPNASYSLTVSGVQDLSGNVLVTTNLSSSVGFYEINHALGGSASQSSTNGGFPSLAIDGNTDGDFSHGSVTLNAPETGGWWEVDLGTAKEIGRLVFWWQTDCCFNKQDNFTYSILDDAGVPVIQGTHAGRPPHPSFAINFGQPLAGRFVRFNAAVPPIGSGEFSLAEVQVFAPHQGLSLAFTTNLPPTRIVVENHAAMFRVAAEALGAPANQLTFQWQTNGMDVAGAVTDTYTTPFLMQADDGLVVRCRVFTSGLVSNSVACAISIAADATPPQIASLDFAPGDSSGTVKFIVRYDERMATISTANATNYTINGVFPDTITFHPDGQTVTLTMPALDAGLGLFCLKIENVTDLAGNVLSPTTRCGVFPFTGLNLALAGAATQSSTGFGGVPELAIDGNTDGNFYNGSVSHTDAPPAANEWWEVNLGEPKPIGRIHLWFRTDYGPEFRDNLRVVIYDVAHPATRAEVWSQAVGTSPPDNLGWTLSPAIVGQAVRVEHVGAVEQFLSLAEVQLFSANAPLNLQVNHLGAEVRLSWPAAVTGLVLEASSMITAGSWASVGETPQLVGDQNVVTLGATNTSRFFRLRKE